MVTVQNIVKKYNIDPEEFDQAKQDYYTYCSTINNKQYDREKAIECFNRFIQMLVSIARIAATESKVKEDADIFTSERKDIIPKVGFVTTDTEIEISIGLFRDFYILAKLSYVNNLSSMGDDFWQLLLRLPELGKFEFKEEPKSSPEERKKYPQLFNKRGSIYKLTRNYFVSQMEYGHCNSLGYLEVKWDNATKFEDLILKYIETFRILYRLNYLLRQEDQKQAKKLR